MNSQVPPPPYMQYLYQLHRPPPPAPPQQQQQQQQQLQPNNNTVYYRQYPPHPQLQRNTQPPPLPQNDPRSSPALNHRMSVMSLQNLPPQRDPRQSVMMIPQMMQPPHFQQPPPPQQQIRPPIPRDTIWRTVLVDQSSLQRPGPPPPQQQQQDPYPPYPDISSPPLRPLAKRDSIASFSSTTSSYSDMQYRQYPHQPPPPTPQDEFVHISHLRALERQLATLQSHLADSQRLISDLKQTSNIQQQHAKDDAEKIHMIQQELNVAILEISRLGHVNDSLESLLNDSISDNSTKSSETTSPNNQVDSNEEIEQLRSDLSNARAAAKQVIQLRAQNAKLEAALAQKSLDADAAANLQRELETSHAERRQLQDTIDAQRTRTTELEQSHAALEQQLNTFTMDLDASRQEVDKLLTLKSKYEAHTQETKKVYESMVAIVESERSRIAVLEDRLKEATLDRGMSQGPPVLSDSNVVGSDVTVPR